MQFRVLAISVLVGIAAAFARADTLEVEQETLASSYRASLGELASRASAAGDANAKVLENWLPEADPAQIILFEPSTLDSPALGGEFAEGFRDLRHAQAEALFALARRAADEGRCSLALRLATEALRENPDHVAARQVLGYEHVDGQWLTPYQARQHRSGKIWHKQFGWIKARDVEKYVSGQRPHSRRWISAAEDAATRRTIDDGWAIATEHFLLTTNHRLEEGVALVSRLESLHALWSQLFADYWLAPHELREAFAGRRSLSRHGRPHQVWYFRSRDEYNAALRREQPRIDITLGIYFDTHRRAYFFAGEDQHPSTIIHEAVHQLFQESRPTARLVGRVNNFWIIEGIATYFESLAVHDDPIAGRYFTLGGPGSGRVPAARLRLLEENYYLPLADLVRLGKDDLQQRPDLTQLYSQLAGLTTFLMHAESGRYRQSLVDYLSAVYSGRASEQTLAELTNQSFVRLDQEYHDFLKALPQPH
jgi:hypothetical protein